MYNLLMELLMGASASLGLHQYRNHWLNRTQIFPHSAPFDGTLYTIGKSEIIKRSGSYKSSRTIVCFPGFLQNQLYFTELYDNCDIEFIAFNNADYYSGLYAKSTVTPHWGHENSYDVATIEYDAHLLCIAIEKLATKSEVLLHGHSRGAAVILEAARQQPQLMKNISALLEAPVLPKGKLSNEMQQFLSYGGLYIFPIFLGFLRNLPTKFTINERNHHPLTPRKRELLAQSPRLPRQYSTAVRNLRNIGEWQSKTDFSVYEYFKEISIVLPQQDSVLCLDTMRKSASQSARIKIKTTQNTNHFITLEQPDTMLEAAGLLDLSGE